MLTKIKKLLKRLSCEHTYMPYTDVIYIAGGMDKQVLHEWKCTKCGKVTMRKEKKMIITGMAHFESVCKKKLVEWYNSEKNTLYNPPKIELDKVFVVWSCKILQNYKALLSTTVSGDGIYAEYTFNGDRQELYEDVYGKLTNTCITEE